jgi:hypothetical protein
MTMSELTNGPMLASMGPRASTSDFGRVVYLFKRHPLAMLNLMWQTTKRSFGPDSEDRKIAQAQLAGMLGMLGMTGGLMGMPLMQQVGMLYDYFWADDDEDDFSTMVRKSLGEAGAFGPLDYITGTRVSERITLGGALYRPGFSSDDMPPLFQLAEGLGGPVLGLGLKYSSGKALEHFNEGRYGRAMEQAMPTSLANFFRAYRYQTEGIQNLRGDPMVDDIGPFHIGAQAMGFMPAEYARNLAVTSAGTRVENAISTKKSRLLQKRNIAIRKGDFETVREIEAEIQEFNARHPRNAILPKTKEQSLAAFQRRSANTQYGLYVAPRNRAMMDEFLDSFGQSDVFQ